MGRRPRADRGAGGALSAGRRWPPFSFAASTGSSSIRLPLGSTGSRPPAAPHSNQGRGPAASKNAPPRQEREDSAAWPTSHFNSQPWRSSRATVCFPILMNALIALAVAMCPVAEPEAPLTDARPGIAGNPRSAGETLARGAIDHDVPVKRVSPSSPLRPTAPAPRRYPFEGPRRRAVGSVRRRCEFAENVRAALDGQHEQMAARRPRPVAPPAPDDQHAAPACEIQA